MKANTLILTHKRGKTQVTLIGQSKKRQEETHRKWKVKHGTGGVNYKIKQETTEPETAEPNQTTGTALSQHKIEYRSLRNKNCATKLLVCGSIQCQRVSWSLLQTLSLLSLVSGGGSSLRKIMRRMYKQAFNREHRLSSVFQKTQKATSTLA